MSEEKVFEEKVIEISRVSRTVKGGKRISFRALVIVGDRNGKVGMGLGKATDVSISIKKGTSQAKKKLHKIFLTEGGSIGKEVEIALNAAKILLKPAPEGTSIIAGGVVRSVCELSGIKNLVSKSYGSNNKINIARATLKALDISSEGAK
ncbi:MAG: 30S ribosomal protein S5 [bacterium]